MHDSPPLDPTLTGAMCSGTPFFILFLNHLSQINYHVGLLICLNMVSACQSFLVYNFSVLQCASGYYTSYQALVGLCSQLFS